MSWTISVGSFNQDIFVDNVVFPELRGAPGYTAIADSNGDNFMYPLLVAFEDGADYAFTTASWVNTENSLTTWIGYAQRTEAAGDTYEMICWIDSTGF